MATTKIVRVINPEVAGACAFFANAPMTETRRWDQLSEPEREAYRQQGLQDPHPRASVLMTAEA